MKKFEIVRKKNVRWYYSPLFTVNVITAKTLKPLIVFSNGDDAVAVFVSRSELANVLKNKFKNHVDRRRQRAKISAP